MHLKSQQIWLLKSNHDITIIYGIIGRCKTMHLNVGSFLTSIDVWKGVGVSVIVTECTVVMLSGVWSMCKSFADQCEEQLLQPCV